MATAVFGGMVLLDYLVWVPEPPVENEMEKLKFRDAARFAVGEVTQTLKDYKDFSTFISYMLAYFLFHRWNKHSNSSCRSLWNYSFRYWIYRIDYSTSCSSICRSPFSNIITKLAESYMAY